MWMLIVDAVVPLVFIDEQIKTLKGAIYEFNFNALSPRDTSKIFYSIELTHFPSPKWFQKQILHDTDMETIHGNFL